MRKPGDRSRNAGCLDRRAKCVSPHPLLYPAQPQGQRGSEEKTRYRNAHSAKRQHPTSPLLSLSSSSVYLVYTVCLRDTMTMATLVKANF